jgi:hypothetical protein
VNFTREPIIETIISAKDGHKLSIRSSKNPGSEEYLVDAVEVVSFGGSFFYRSQERIKAFFLPSNDYEIQEVKETRVLIKNPTLDKSVKIAGGKEASLGAKNPPQEASSTTGNKETSQEEESLKPTDQKREKKQRYRKNRRQQSDSQGAAPQGVAQPAGEGMEGTIPTPAPTFPQPGIFSHLLKPPERLISDTLGKYRQERSPTVSVVEQGESSEPKEVVLSETEEGSTNIEPPRVERHKKHNHGSFSREKPKKEMIVEDEQLVSEAPGPGDLLEETDQLIPSSILSMPTHGERITPDMIDEMDRPPIDHQE